MIDMPRKLPPNLYREFTRHRTPVWYVRIGKGPRTRIRAEFGTDEFMAEYHAAITGNAPQRTSKVKAGTLAWAVALYRQSSAWLALSAATRRQRENIFKKIIANAGESDINDITRKVIIDGRERRAATPAAARHFIETMRGLFKWAVDIEVAKTDPTESVKVAKKKGEGFEAWTDADIEKFDKRWPLGTRERIAKDVLFYSGLRRGDAATFGRPHVKDGVARLTTEKTGERVTFLIEPELAASIAAGPCGEMTYIASAGRQPMKKESFGNWFREACDAAGIKKSAHGLRKAAATRDANRGWSESELEAKYGWRGGRMASHYTRTMNRDKLAVDAAKRTGSRTETPAPVNEVRDLERKTK